ncbi:MAG TPA: hypothetical protein VFQ53_34895 [Kofleriaceae bacterium]|nr:hypothetical protein [Kofleriaceae bacterium]
MPFAGTLQQASGYTFEAQSSGTTKGAVTVFTIRKDRISEVETFTAGGGQLNRTISTGVARLIFMVTPVTGNNIVLTIQQGAGLTINETVSSDQQFVFDVA